MEKGFKYLVASLLVIIVLLLGVILVLVLNDRKVIENSNSSDNNARMELTDDDLFDETDDYDDVPTTFKPTATKTNKTTSVKYISKEKAVNIALKDAKISKNDIFGLEIELERKYSQMVYEIDFDYGKHEYEYYINAESGRIIKSFIELDLD